MALSQLKPTAILRCARSDFLISTVNLKPRYSLDTLSNLSALAWPLPFPHPLPRLLPEAASAGWRGHPVARPPEEMRPVPRQVVCTSLHREPLQEQTHGSPWGQAYLIEGQSRLSKPHPYPPPPLLPWWGGLINDLHLYGALPICQTLFQGLCVS